MTPERLHREAEDLGAEALSLIKQILIKHDKALLEECAAILREELKRERRIKTDLLEALLGMMDAYMDLCDESEPNYRSFEFRQERWKAARAAIAKAKGEA